MGQNTNQTWKITKAWIHHRDNAGARLISTEFDSKQVSFNSKQVNEWKGA